MKTCIYCALSKPDSDFSSLEHLIPQFLGGSCAPDRFKTRDACARCNSILGLFVDGSFSRSWIVKNWLTFAGMAAYTQASKIGPPLMFAGVPNLEMPGVEKHEVCESWLGPAGEQIYLVRPADDRFYWYAGGNPITAKEVETRAYFIFSERSHVDLRRTILAFRDSFQGEKVKKVTCTQVDGFDMATIGFSEPDELDHRRIEFLHSENQRSPVKSVSIPMKLDFDYRFMSKLALGVGYAVAGGKLIKSDYYHELKKGVWFKVGDADPEIRGAGILGDGPTNKEAFRNLAGMKYAVTLSIMVMNEGVALTLALGVNHAWTILCAPREVIDDELLEKYRYGMVLVIYPLLNECIELTQAEFLSHKLGNALNPKLSAAEAAASAGEPKPKGESK